MSTLLEIECAGQRQSITISHPICRIGSNPNLELCVPGIEGHAATLRIVQGKHLIYNRSPKPLRMGHKRLAADQTLEWASGETLELGEGICLRLVNARSAIPATPAVGRQEASPVAVSGEPPKSIERTQRRGLLLGFFMVLGTILFLSDSNEDDPRMTYEATQLVSQLRACAKQSDVDYAALCFHLENGVLRRELRKQSKFALISQLEQSRLEPELQSALLSFAENHFN